MCHCIGDPSLRQAKSWLPLSAFFVTMIEFLIVILAIGFCIYYTFRHPVKSLDVVCRVMGLLVLGFLGMIGFFFMVYGILTLL